MSLRTFFTIEMREILLFEIKLALIKTLMFPKIILKIFWKYQIN